MTPVAAIMTAHVAGFSAAMERDENDCIAARFAATHESASGPSATFAAAQQFLVSMPV